MNVELDFNHNDKLQTNVIINEIVENSLLDKTTVSRNYPRIIKNEKCNINITILPKSTDLTAHDSFDTSILDKSLELSDISIFDI